MSLSAERAAGARRVNATSATQHVEVPCPSCGQLTRCVVQYGLFDELLEPCAAACHRTDEEYDHPALEERAVDAALVQRHDIEFGEA